MKKRLAYLTGFFALMLLFFIIQKPGFMFYNDAVGRGIPMLDYFKVMWHISYCPAVAGNLYQHLVQTFPAPENDCHLLHTHQPYRSNYLCRRHVPVSILEF